MDIINRSLAMRMALLILLGAGFVVILVEGFSHMTQRRRMLEADAKAGATLAKSIVSQIESELGRAEAVVQQSAAILADREFLREESAALIRRTLETHPAIFGMAVALTESEAARSDFKIQYGWRGADGIEVRERESPSEDYRQDWFAQPARMKKPVWVEPYYDEQAGAAMVTYSVPILRGGDVVAVVTCDLSLADIRSLIAGLALGKEGMAVLISRRGTFIAHPNRPALEMKETIFTLADSHADPEIGRGVRELGDHMLAGMPGHTRYRRPYGDDLRIAHMYHDTVPCTGWAFGIFWPEDQVLAPLARLNRINAMVAVGSLVLLLIPAMGIALSVARPLRRLADAANRLAAGDFETALPEIRAGDEVDELAKAFDQMRRDLRRYIADLTATTAAKERMAGELSAAREIQMGIVPKLFPPFPSRPDIDLYAILIPALEVGGDLYDFTLLDEDHLYVAIGDVSGKGIPASLMMAVGKTLLKSTMQAVRDPARALAQVNNELSEDNDTCMFITMFCGILNLKTGDLIYANAGHNPPFLSRAAGGIERLDEPPSPALGVRAGIEHINRSRRLDTGDLLVLYTDGVTEAMDPAQAMFGEKGLIDHIRREGRQSAKLFLKSLGRAVQTHAASAPQSDDITALVVRYRAIPSGADVSVRAVESGAPAAALTLRNDLGELPRLTEWVETTAAELGAPPSLMMKLNLVLEEWIVNVISYAFPDTAEHSIQVRLWRERDEVRVIIEDDGRPFDPTAQAAADTSLSIEHRPIGGLGIHFIRKTMDGFSYRREGARNIVTLSKRIAEESA